MNRTKEQIKALEYYHMISIGKTKCTSENGLLKTCSAILGPEIMPTPRASDVLREKLRKSRSIDSNLRGRLRDFSLILF